MKQAGDSSIKDFCKLAARAQACTVCAEHLPHSPRPVFRASPSARLRIVAQAPRRCVHGTSMSWFEWKVLPALQVRVGTERAAEDNGSVHSQV